MKAEFHLVSISSSDKVLKQFLFYFKFLSGLLSDLFHFGLVARLIQTEWFILSTPFLKEFSHLFVDLCMLNLLHELDQVVCRMLDQSLVPLSEIVVQAIVTVGDLYIVDAIEIGLAKILLTPLLLFNHLIYMISNK